MKKLHEAGFKTFASIEPIVDFKSSFEMIQLTLDFCDLYKIGLMSGKKYDKHELCKFMFNSNFIMYYAGAKVYFKDSLLKMAGKARNEGDDNWVGRDFKLHEI